MITAIIPTFNNREGLRACTDSLRHHKQCGYLVVNNSPPRENRYYTRAINDGIREVLYSGYWQKSVYLLICCDDVVVKPGAVALLAKYLGDNPKCAIASPVQTHQGKITWAGSEKAWPNGMHFVVAQSASPYETSWANGACFLVRVEAVRECGLMDEGMKFICSDADWSFTMRARGWGISVVPSAEVDHAPRGAVDTTTPELQLIKMEDQLYFTDKWLTGDLLRGLGGTDAHPDLVRSFKEKTLAQIRQAKIPPTAVSWVDPSPPQLTPLV